MLDKWTYVEKIEPPSGKGVCLWQWAGSDLIQLRVAVQKSGTRANVSALIC